MDSLLRTLLKPEAKSKDTEEESSGSTSSRSGNVSPQLEARSPSPIIQYEQPEGWKEGVPMPWTQRFVHYDKPLPVPTRTPSPMQYREPPMPGMEENRSPTGEAYRPVGEKEGKKKVHQKKTKPPIPAEHPGASQLREREMSPQVFIPTAWANKEEQPAKDQDIFIPSGWSSKGEAGEETKVTSLESGFMGDIEANASPLAKEGDLKPIDTLQDIPSSIDTAAGATALATSSVEVSTETTMYDKPEKLTAKKLEKPTYEGVLTGKEGIGMKEKEETDERLEKYAEAFETSPMIDVPSASPKQQIFRHGNKDDWQVQRQYPVEQFYEPNLFEYFGFTEATPSLPTEAGEQKTYHKGNKDDWQVTRKYPVEHFYEPWLFKEGYPDLVEPIHLTSDQKQAEIEQTSWLKGNKLDWQAIRQYPVDHFYNPELFNPDGVFFQEKNGQIESPKQHLRANKEDWQTIRENLVEEFSEPKLFEEEEAAKVKEPITAARGKQKEAKRIPTEREKRIYKKNRVKREEMKRKTSHGYQELTRNQKKHIYKYRKGNKDDWQVSRRHYVDRYYEPKLFFRRYQKILSPGEGLRRDWKGTNQHMIDHYYNPHLFDEPPQKLKSWGDYLRENWKTTRQNYVEEFYEPSLFEEKPSEMRKGKEIGMAEREKEKGISEGASEKEMKQKPEKKKFVPADLGARYREDWKVERQYPVEHFYVPELFSEEREGPKEPVGALKRGHEALSPSPFAEELAEKRTRTSQEEKAFTPPKPHHMPDRLYERLVEEVLSDRQAQKESEQDIESSVSEEEEQSPRSLEQIEEDSNQAWEYAMTVGLGNVDGSFLRGHLLTNNGIPEGMRAKVWRHLAGGAIVESLAQLYQQLKEEPVMIPRGIEIRLENDCKDIPQLEDVMRAYSLYDPVVAYSPAYTQIAKTLLDYLPEEYAFALLVRLSFAYDLRLMHAPGINGLQCQLYVLDRLVEEHIPDVADHMGKLGVTSVDYAGMALSSFSTQCTTFAPNILDWIFLEGMPALHSVMLGVLASHQEQLLYYDEGDEISQYLRKHLFDVDETNLLYDSASLFPISTEEYQQELINSKEVVLQSSTLASQEEIMAVDSDNSDVRRLLADFYDMILAALADREQLIRLAEDRRHSLSSSLETSSLLSARVHSLEAYALDQEEVIEEVDKKLKEKDEIIDKLTRSAELLQSGKHAEKDFSAAL